MSVGTSLSEVRKTANLSTGELSKRTRIPESVIEDFDSQYKRLFHDSLKNPKALEIINQSEILSN